MASSNAIKVAELEDLLPNRVQEVNDLCERQIFSLFNFFSPAECDQEPGLVKESVNPGIPQMIKCESNRGLREEAKK